MFEIQWFKHPVHGGEHVAISSGTRVAVGSRPYGGIKQFSPWTISKEYAERLFHFGFAMLLYDLWLLVDFLVQKSLDVVEFRGFLRRKLVTLI
jgi:hypothetical protein